MSHSHKPHRRTRRVLAPLALITLGVILLSGCYNVPTDMTAIRIGGGLENSKPKGCIKPGNRNNMPGNDDYVYFPISEREWDATGQKGSDGGQFASVTKDSVEMQTPVTIRFTLITTCKQLNQVLHQVRPALRGGVRGGRHLQQGLDHPAPQVGQGPGDATLDRIVQDYNWRSVWNDPKTKVEIEKRMNEAEIDGLDGGPGPRRVLRGDLGADRQAAHRRTQKLAKAVAAEQTNVAKAQSAEAQAKADLTKARGRGRGAAGGGQEAPR